MQNISARSILRKLKAGRPAPAYSKESWPHDGYGNPMHPTKGFRKHSRRGKRCNRSR